MRKFGIETVKIREKNMVRDMSNKALLNTDLESLRAYRDKKTTMEKINATILEVVNLRSEINTLKLDLSEIKDILLEKVISR